MRTPRDNETFQEYIQPYMSAYQSARNAVVGYARKRTLPGYSAEHEKELGKAYSTAAQDLQTAQNTYREWESVKIAQKKTITVVQPIPQPTTRSNASSSTTRSTSAAQSSAAASAPAAKRTSTTTARPKKDAATILQNVKQYNDYIEKTHGAYGQSDQKYSKGERDSKKVPKPLTTTQSTAKTTTQSVTETAKETAKKERPSRAPVIKFTGAAGELANAASTIKNVGDLASVAGGIILNQNSGKVEKVVNKVAEVQKALSGDNQLWNKKIDSSKEQLWTNLKKQGWTVPDDDAGRAELYKKVQDMSPDLFYHGAYVGTDKKALNAAKKAFNNSKISGLAGIALDSSKLTESQKKLAAQLLVDQNIKTVAQNLVDQKFQEVVDKRVLDTLAKFGYDKNAAGCIQALKDVVRGSMYAKIASQDTLQQMVNDTAANLKSMIDKKTDEVIGKYGDMAMGKITPAIEKMNGKIDEGFAKADKLLKKSDEVMAKLETKLAMVSDIDKTINGKLDGLNSKLNSKLAKYGIEMDFSPMYKDAVGAWGKDINSKLNTAQVGQKISAVKQQVAQIATQIQNYKKMVKEYIEGAKALVAKWVNVIKDKVKAMTTKLLNNLVQSVNVSAGCIKLNF